MNFILKSSLEQDALVKVAAILWNQSDIRTLVLEFSRTPLFQETDREIYFSFPVRISEKRINWQKIEDRVIEKISQLTICDNESLKEKLLGCIQAVGFQILKWMEYHRFICRIVLHDLPNEFSWTTGGTISKQKTAEMLIRDENINIIMRYKLACTYCLEDDIRALWNKMPESDREIFYCEEDSTKVTQQKLVVFWTYFIKGEVDKLGDASGRELNRRCSSYRYAFRCAAISSNKAATEYFFKKLRNKLLIVKTARKVISRSFSYIRKRPPEEYSAEVLFYLFSQMNREQQIEVFKFNPFRILRFFLHWPWQQFFVETASFLWNLLNKSDCHVVLRIIFEKILFGYTDYNYAKLFQELWQQMPATIKSCIINSSCIAGLAEMITHIKDKRKVHIFSLIFEDATSAEKNHLIFSKRGQLLCEALIENGDWDLIKYFIQLYVTSKDDMICFKQHFEQFVETRIEIYEDSEDKYAEMENKFHEFSRILDDFIREYGRRENDDEGNNNTAKEFCISE